MRLDLYAVARQKGYLHHLEDIKPSLVNFFKKNII